MTSYVESAYYGDGKTMNNITSILANRVVGSTLSVDVNENLIPPFEVAPKTELDTKEEAEIRGRASASCGADKACMERTERRMRQEALLEKEAKADSSSPANTVKGRRMTLNVIGPDLVRRQIVVPEGQKYTLENVMATDPKKKDEVLPPFKWWQNQFYAFSTIVLIAFLYVFSVVATYTVFARRLGPIIAAIATIIAVFTPFSGYFLIIAYFTTVAAANKYIELSSR